MSRDDQIDADVPSNMLAIRIPTYYVTADDVVDILYEMLPPFKRTVQETPNVWDDQAVALLERCLANPVTRDLLGRVLGRDADLPSDVLMLTADEGVIAEYDLLRNALINGDTEPSDTLMAIADTSNFDIGTIITLLPQTIAIAQALIALWQSRNPRGGGRGRRGRALADSGEPRKTVRDTVGSGGHASEAIDPDRRDETYED